MDQISGEMSFFFFFFIYIRRRLLVLGLIGKLQSFPRDIERHVSYSSKEETTHLPNGSIPKHRSPMVMFPRGT